jgi:hypothetical protein
MLALRRGCSAVSRRLPEALEADHPRVRPRREEAESGLPSGGSSAYGRSPIPFARRPSSTVATVRRAFRSMMSIAPGSPPTPSKVTKA